MRLTTLLMAGLLGSACALAQTPPAQPAAKPAPKSAAKPPAIVVPKPAAARPATAAADAGRTVGSGSGPILTREELRSCMSQEQSVRGRITESEARRAALTKEKDALSADQETLRGERPGADAAAQADAVRARMKDYGDRVSAWNAKAAEFSAANRSGPQADRGRLELDREREELGKLQQQVEAEKDRVNAAIAQSTAAYNAKVTAQDGRVTDWNQRNRQLNDDAQALEGDRQTWLSACKDRRYREDDETAIRSGK